MELQEIAELLTAENPKSDRLEALLIVPIMRITAEGPNEPINYLRFAGAQPCLSVRVTAALVDLLERFSDLAQRDTRAIVSACSQQQFAAVKALREHEQKRTPPADAE